VIFQTFLTIKGGNTMATYRLIVLMTFLCFLSNCLSQSLAIKQKQAPKKTPIQLLPELKATTVNENMPVINAQQSDKTDTKTVTASGESTISCDDAILIAQQNAVSKAGQTYIKSHHLIVNAEMIRQVIISDTEGYIDTYMPINKGTDDKCIQTDDFYITTIQATVKRQNLKDSINGMAILQKAIGSPTIAVIVKEKYPEPYFQSNLRIVKAKTEEMLLKRGFSLKDKEHQAIISGDSRFAAFFDIIGQSEVNISKVPDDIDPDYKNCDAAFNGRILHTQTGTLIASFTSNALNHTINPINGCKKTLEQAVEKAVESKIIPQLCKKWQHYFVHGLPIHIVLKGVQYKEHFASIIKRLKAMPRMNEIIDTSFDGENDATIDIMYRAQSIMDFSIAMTKEIFPDLKEIKHKNYTLWVQAEER